MHPQGTPHSPRNGSRLAQSDSPPPYSPTYSRVSSFRSPQFEVILYSPAVKSSSTAWTPSRTTPVYADHDVVGGKIILDSSCRSGRIILTISGAVVSNVTPEDMDKLPHLERAGKRRHIFFLQSEVIDVTASDSSSSRSGFRQVFKRRQTTYSPEDSSRAFPISFQLGRSAQPGDSLPPSYSSDSTRAPPFEIGYQVTATWEPLKLTEKSSFLSIPIAIRPDPDFQLVDGLSETRISWLEVPLKSLRPIPFRCAITLPSSLTFSRNSPVPFFVVFTTVPRSKTLAREIATDATISITISRRVTVVDDTAIVSQTAKGLVSNVSSVARSPRLKPSVLRRITSKTSLWSAQSSTVSHTSDVLYRPPPRVSSRCSFSDTQVVYSGMWIGFPKRPRHQLSGGDKPGHPSLEDHHALPDGLHKGNIALNRNMLASVDWGGISLKYFLEVTVVFGQEELSTKLVLRIT